MDDIVPRLFAVVRRESTGTREFAGLLQQCTDDYVNEIQDKDGRTLFMQALISRNLPTAQLLLEKDMVDLDLQDKTNSNALMLAIEYKYKNHDPDYQDIIDNLLDNSDINLLNSEGISPLINTVIYGDIALTKKLLSKGADANLVWERDGRTALEWAVIKRREEEVELLLSHGAQATINDRDGAGKTALILLVENPEHASMDPIKILRLLLAHGADVNIQDTTGKTALDYAAVNTRRDILEVLQQAQRAGLDENKLRM